MIATSLYTQENPSTATSLVSGSGVLSTDRELKFFRTFGKRQVDLRNYFQTPNDCIDSKMFGDQTDTQEDSCIDNELTALFKDICTPLISSDIEKINISIYRELQILALTKEYSISNFEEIKQLLLAQPIILTTLLEARPIIESIFGESIKINLILKPITNFTNENKIWGIIDTSNLNLELAMNYLQKFDEDWFVNKIDSVNSNLNFDIT